jgi:hypothetical protein
VNLTYAHPSRLIALVALLSVSSHLKMMMKKLDLVSPVRDTMKLKRSAPPLGSSRELAFWIRLDEIVRQRRLHCFTFVQS